MREKYSGLLLQKRLLNEEDVDIHTSARTFVPIEGLDLEALSTAKAFFTIGVVVELAGPLTAKTGKPFSILKISDLVKYDIAKVRKVLAAKADKDVA